MLTNIKDQYGEKGALLIERLRISITKIDLDEDETFHNTMDTNEQHNSELVIENINTTLDEDEIEPEQPTEF